jgi:GntR family transcriptional regulator
MNADSESLKRGLDPKSSVPLHAQLEEIIRKNIAENIWPENERIPSENELSRQYGLSRMTVRSVILRLAQADLLYRVPGKGTFVNVKNSSQSRCLTWG